MAVGARDTVVVIGGANSDVVGVSTDVLVARDSNPGVIRESAGGVARNIAENLARLGAAVSLITAFGADDASERLRRSCTDVGIDVSLALADARFPCARYLAVLDERHDMTVAINDMRVLDTLTPERLAEPERARAIAAAAVVVLDANLPASSLAWVLDNTDAAVVFEPVSVAKCVRAARLLPALAAVTPNAAEAAALLGRDVANLDGAEAAAREFVALGLRTAFVTCGPDGIAWAGAEGSGVLPAPAVEVANASGAGDAFCAGVAFGILTGASARACARAGTRLAAATLADADTVSSEVAPALLVDVWEG